MKALGQMEDFFASTRYKEFSNSMTPTLIEIETETEIEIETV